MKKKELDKLAHKIISLEDIIERNTSPEEVTKAKKQIMDISGRLEVEDMLRIDEIIQEYLKKS